MRVNTNIGFVSIWCAQEFLDEYARQSLGQNFLEEFGQLLEALSWASASVSQELARALDAECSVY